MNPTLLPFAVANVEAELEASLPRFFAIPPVFDQYVEICTLWRRVAIGSFLLSADAALLFENLSKSIGAFLHGLESVPSESIVTSGFLSFFDALACRDEAAIARMIGAAPRSPQLDREYEEEFLYPRIAMDLAAGADAAEIDGALERYTALAAKNPDGRLPVLVALRERNASAFAAAVREVSEAWRDETQANLDEDSGDPDDAAFAPVSVEILGWIELAERLGIQVERSYPLAPALARAFHRLTSAPRDSWRSV